MQTLSFINFLIALIFTVCYAYQFLYIPVPWIKKAKTVPGDPPLHSFAVLICARNEAGVIGDLLDSLKAQTYPGDRITVFVEADNCTDDTAEVAALHGAVVYTRFNKIQVGKGYALEDLLGNIRRDYPEGFDGYFVFDADNVLRADYIEQMNRTFSEGNDLITSYRNSKNYGDNWISAGYALWFLRESRYLNNARYLLHTSCAVSGTGFFFSRKIAEEIGGWPYHLLAEDIEFTIDQITKGRKVAFCRDAVLYDEQPVRFSQSWRQRMRWSRGYLQVIRHYGARMIRGAVSGSFSCFDMTMTIMPAFFLSAASVVCNLVFGIWGAAAGDDLMIAVRSIAELFWNMYFTVFFIGAVTTVTEWKEIMTSPAKKILYMFTFPFFMFTYIPISLVALVKNTGWQPIEHTRNVASLKTKLPCS